MTESRDRSLARWNDPAYVASYIRFTLPMSVNAREWAERLGVGATSFVIDLGCGEGKLLTALAPHVDRGLGIDVSPHMADAARKRLAESGISNVEVVCQDFRDLDVGENVADAVVSIAALHHVPDEDKQAIFAKIHTTLRPGGLFCLGDDSFNFPPEEIEVRVPQMYAQWEQRFGREKWETMKRELAGDDFEHTPFLEDLKRMLTEAELAIVTIEPRGLNGVQIAARKA